MPNIKGALAALQAYLDSCGSAERDEPQDWQASDLITDLLHLFSEHDMEDILRRAYRDWPEERAEAHYIGQSVRRADCEKKDGTPAHPGVIDSITAEGGEVTYWVRWDGSTDPEPHYPHEFRAAS